MIETNHGVQLPALLHSLTETFSRDGADQSSCRDKDFMSWLSSKLLERQHEMIEDTPAQIGKGVGIQIDYSGDADSNKDPFTLLVPAEGS